MNPLILVATLILFGFLFNSWWLALLGVLAIFLLAAASFLKTRKLPKNLSDLPKDNFEKIPVPAGGRGKHKLLQAPQDMWDTDEEILTYMSAMSSMSPFSLYNPVSADPLRAISQAYHEGEEVPRDVLRNTLPFSSYGRDTVFEQIFIGLPINLGSLIKRR